VKILSFLKIKTLKHTKRKSLAYIFISYIPWYSLLGLQKLNYFYIANMFCVGENFPNFSQKCKLLSGRPSVK
jgi:hypothetical protein